ncbi:MAG: hypothetical protein ABSC42_12805 [Tepidisphaeraceae bacterium]|jgi:hypothetical protein
MLYNGGWMLPLTTKSLKILVLLAGVCAGGGAAAPVNPPVTGPTTSPDSDAAQLIAETQRAIAQWDALPQLPACPINQVVRFSEEQGILTADWPILHNGPLQARISLTDLPGHAVIKCMLSHRLGIFSPMFECYELSRPAAICRHLQIVNNIAHLQVVQEIESVDRFESISLIETLDGSDAPPVTLRVQVIQGTQPQLSLVMPAATLPDLRRDHPYEFEKYLRPLFRQFGQDEAIFAVEDKIGWQVMDDDWRPPPDLAARLKSLVAQLNSNEFARRQSAQDSLRRIGEPAALMLRSADRRDWTPEQNSRVNKLLAEFFPLSDDQAEKLGQDVNFLLDCLTSDDPALRAATLVHLDRLLGKKIECNLDQSPADRLTAVGALRRQLIPQATTRDSSE